MTFNLTLTEAQEIDLRERLTGLTDDMTYDRKAKILIIVATPGNESRIRDVVSETIKIKDLPETIETKDLPRWKDLSRQVAKSKRHEELQRLRTKRSRQARVRVERARLGA